MSNAFDTLTVDDQISHVQDLWDRIAARPENVPVSDAWRGELSRRMAEHEANPEAAIPWEQVRDELHERFGPKK